MSALADASGSRGFGRLELGFANPVHDAQACFRTVLDALAHPGRVIEAPRALSGSPPAALGAAATAIALTLCDIDTPVWLDEAAASAASYLTFHCGARFAAVPVEARFAFIGDPAVLTPLDEFALGTDEFPERSTTLVIKVSGLATGSGVVLRGPGIQDASSLNVTGLPPRFWAERIALAELFPRGIDVLFVAGDRLAAMPRSTRIVI